jgi:hypothetical protein
MKTTALENQWGFSDCKAACLVNSSRQNKEFAL